MDIFIPVITRKCSVKIWPEEVIYIEKKARKVNIVVEGGEYEYYGKIEDIDPYLDRRFCKCRKTLIINMDKVEKIGERAACLHNGVKLFLGRESYIRTKQTYSAYLKNYI